MIKSDEYKIFFCGISKNCHKTIENNLKFISDFVKKSKYNTVAIFVDSDSEDGTKDLIKKSSLINKKFIFHNLDGLEEKYSNRIERIQISRNECLKIMYKDSSKFKIYIPLDLDIDLFNELSIQDLERFIDCCIKKDELNGIFPFSKPFYYDIFALRATNWLNLNSQYWVTRYKKYIRIGSFFVNYALIFRHQITPQKFKNKNSKIISAFGGMGIYKLNNKILFYKLSSIHPRDVSEHVSFNSQFDELEILSHWNVPAPPEHLEYRIKNFKGKVRYILSTIFFDLVKHTK